MEDILKSMALLCKAYAELYRKYEELKRSSVATLESFTDFKQELDNFLEPARTCEFCGKIISKPKRRLCSTTCQVSQMHKDKGHNVRPHKHAKPAAAPAPAPAAQESKAEEDKPGK